MSLIVYVVCGLVLAGCIFWRCCCDYAELLVRRKMPDGPLDWSALERGDIPQTSDEQLQKQKNRFSHSHEVHGRCVPRTSWYSLTTQPLKMDE